jgi:hypothetical protein
MEGSKLLFVFRNVPLPLCVWYGEVHQMQNKQNVVSFSVESSRTRGLVELRAAALVATANAVVITDQTVTVIWVNSAFEQLVPPRRAVPTMGTAHPLRLFFQSEGRGCWVFSVQSPPFLKSKRRFRIREIIDWARPLSLHEVTYARRNGTQDLGRVATSF